MIFFSLIPFFDLFRKKYPVLQDQAGKEPSCSVFQEEFYSSHL